MTFCERKGERKQRLRVVFSAVVVPGNRNFKWKSLLLPIGVKTASRKLCFVGTLLLCVKKCQKHLSKRKRTAEGQISSERPTQKCFSLTEREKLQRLICGRRVKTNTSNPQKIPTHFFRLERKHVTFLGKPNFTLKALLILCKNMPFSHKLICVLFLLVKNTRVAFKSDIPT